MTEFSVNSIKFLAAAIVVLFVGLKVNRKVEFLSKNFIPGAAGVFLVQLARLTSPNQ